MSFNNFTNNRKEKTQNLNLSKTIFKESLTLIEKTWDRWDKSITTLKNDIKTIDRLNNEYGNDIKYLELKDIIIKKINITKNNLAQLEKLVLEVKSSIETSGQ
tara:strand:+ start:143 stop:451 length:309 start_codon:yes stop_codon:yes gene_type:complete